MRWTLCVSLTLLEWMLCLNPVAADRLPVPIGSSFHAEDTLQSPRDSRPDALVCLRGLCWQPGAFEVTCDASQQEDVAATIRFPSPRPIGNAQSDLVAMEWYANLDEQQNLRTSPVVIVVHESGSGMTVGRIVAKGLRARGVHAVMLQLPFYGLRRPAGQKPEGQNIAVLMGQGIADARRALDAARVLPGVDRGNVSLLGISLGGFVSATCAGLDGSFDHVFILLAGGNLPELVKTGERETAQLREKLAQQGYTGEKMQELLNRVEPNRLAHRINKETLWVYSATMDTVVPPVHADEFARAAGLAEDHHEKFPANHYSGILFLPAILDQVVARVGSQPVIPQK